MKEKRNRLHSMACGGDDDDGRKNGSSNSNSSHFFRARSLSLHLPLYKYINTCKLSSSRPHHQRTRERERREERESREKLLCIVFSSSYSEIINNIDRSRIYIYAHASIVTHQQGEEKRKKSNHLIIYFHSCAQIRKQVAWLQRLRSIRIVLMIQRYPFIKSRNSLLMARKCCFMHYMEMKLMKNFVSLL